MVKTLAIETSCDDTSIGIIEGNWSFFREKKLISFSQIKNHQEYGGVVPEIASRLHNEKFQALLKNIWKEDINDVDFVSVTSTPWLPGSLIVWITWAYSLGEYFWKEVVEVNHINWHIFSLFLERSVDETSFPIIVLTASWGHNDIYYVDYNKNGFSIERLWRTIDDAAGECFDKISKMLGGPYPWGAWVWEKASVWVNDSRFYLKRAYLDSGDFNFSFSWIKAGVKRIIDNSSGLSEQDVCNICFEAQECIVEILWKKLIKASEVYEANTIWIAGGVSCNKNLVDYVNKNTGKEFIVPVKNIYSTDNAAMIWVAGILSYYKKF